MLKLMRLKLIKENTYLISLITNLVCYELWINWGSGISKVSIFWYHIDLFWPYSKKREQKGDLSKISYTYPTSDELLDS